ncbi:AMP-binding protein [Sphaerisporangium corydalis]|uniref:AMP-binding protein n=1 Tax=Sphaerisporangium corydalis TaxID=1441875 RepID=A0ABV9ENU2_9ACTN|nr:AMP-binding protein [Sphaerisporangium corydalis]
MMPSTFPAAATVTGALLGRAGELGDRHALVDIAAGGAVYTYQRLAASVTRAAAGLVKRGMRAGQVSGVYVHTVPAQIVALLSVIAAGGVALPLSVSAGLAGVAKLLVRHDVRLLFTTPDLVEAAEEMADASRIRQIVTFGPTPKSVDFEDLLAPGEFSLPMPDPVTEPAVATAQGVLTHREFLSGARTLDRTADVTASDVVLVAWPLDGGCDIPVLVSLALMRGATVVAVPGITRSQLRGIIADFGITLVALVDGDRKVISRL